MSERSEKRHKYSVLHKTSIYIMVMCLVLLTSCGGLGGGGISNIVPAGASETGEIGAISGFPSPLTKDEKRYYVIEDFQISYASNSRGALVKEGMGEELGDNWRYWLHGYKPLGVEVTIYQTQISRGGINSGSWVLWRLTMIDKEDNRVLGDYTYRSQESGGLGAYEKMEDKLALRIVNDLRLLFYYGYN